MKYPLRINFIWISVLFIHVNGQQLTLKEAELNSDVSLPCTFSIANLVLRWYGPGDVKYTEDTNIIANDVKSHISVVKDFNTKLYTLTIRSFQTRFTGVYSCLVNNSSESQILLTTKDSTITKVYTRIEGNVTLKCLDPVPTSTSWNALPSRAIYTINLDINPNLPNRNRISVDVITRSLIINFVQLSDIAEYMCIDRANPANVNVVHLLLYLEPEYPEIEKLKLINGHNRTQNIVEDSPLTLTCNSPNGFPPAIVGWRKQHESNILARGFNTATYTMTGSRNEDLKIYTCQSSSPAFVNNVSTDVLLYFILKPLSVSITKLETVTAGTILDATCTSAGSRPSATITWNFRNVWINDNSSSSNEDLTAMTYTVKSVLRRYLEKSDNGELLQCRASNAALPGGRLSDTVKLNVVYPPDITITYSNSTYNQTFNKMICAADGNPRNYTYYAWEHKTQLGQYVRSFLGESTSDTSTLTIPDLGDNLNFQNNGYYVCTTSNGIPNKNGRTNVSKEVYFDVAAPPVIKKVAFMNTGEPYSNVSLTIPYYSNPVNTSIKWSRNQENDVFDISGDRFVQIVTEAVISLPFHGKNIMFKGKNATLMIQNIQKTEFTNYTLRIKNSVGETQYTVGIQPVGPPNQPVGIAAVCTSINTAEIIWISKFNGGEDQHFLVGVKTTKKETYTVLKKLTDPGENEIMREVVDDLEDGTKYFFRVYAENKYGRSMFANDLQCVTPAKVVEKSATDEPNTASIVLFVISTVFFVFVVTGVSIICFLIRKRKSPDKRAKQDEIQKEKDIDLTNAYQDLGKCEQPVDAQYQELENLSKDGDSTNKRNVYQELGAREKQSNDQYQQLESRYTGSEPKSKKANVYDTLEKGDPPNVYEEINTKKTKRNKKDVS